MLREEVQIWCADTDVDADPHSLSSGEMLRASRFVFDRDRRRWIAARVLLRRALGKYLGVHPGSIRFACSAHGKPMLAMPGFARDIRFNLSHSAGAAVCATTERTDIGIDIEQIRPVDNLDQVFRSFATSREYSAFAALSPSEKQCAFFKAWTLKEACLKADGAGLSISPASIEVLEGTTPRRLVTSGPRRWSAVDFAIGNGWAGALALTAADERVVVPELAWRAVRLEPSAEFTSQS